MKQLWAALRRKVGPLLEPLKVCATLEKSAIRLPPEEEKKSGLGCLSQPHAKCWRAGNACACVFCTLSPLCLTAQITFHTSLPRVLAHVPDIHNWDKIKICAIYARIKYSMCFHAESGFQKTPEVYTWTHTTYTYSI